MFTIDPKFTHIRAGKDEVVCLWRSINPLRVKVPGLPVDPATAYVVSVREPGDKRSVVVYLHYADLRRAVAYKPVPERFPASELEEVMEQARYFLESMGFMLDDTDFNSLSAEQQAQSVARTPAFFAELDAFAKSDSGGGKTQAAVDGAAAPTPTSTSRQAVGRLLMSF